MRIPVCPLARPPTSRFAPSASQSRCCLNRVMTLRPYARPTSGVATRDMRPSHAQLTVFQASKGALPHTGPIRHSGPTHRAVNPVACLLASVEIIDHSKGSVFINPPGKARAQPAQQPLPIDLGRSSILGQMRRTSRRSNQGPAGLCSV